MIKKEFKKIWENKLLLATVIVVALIPILYASVFLKSIWDPYGNMNELPVAVVNLDKSVDFEGKTLSVGSELVDNLKKNEELGWHFVSQDAAKQGLKDRKYYMIVTIPEDFSKNAATVLDSDPEKMNLKYETNAGVNYLGEVVSDNAMNQLKAQVGEEVTKSYATAIISMIKEVGSGMETAAEGSEKLSTGADKLNTGLETLAESVPTLADGVSQLDSGAGALQSGVSQYTAGVAKVADGSNQLNAGVGQLTSQLPTLTNGLSALGNGANSLTGGLVTYTNGVAQIGNGNQQLAAKMPALVKGISDLTAGADQLSTSLSAINLSATDKDNLLAYVNGVQTYLKTVNSALGAIDSSQLSQIGQLSTVLKTVSTNLTNVGTNLTAIQNGLEQAVTNDVASNTAAVAKALNLNPDQQKAVAGALGANAQNSQVLSLVKSQLTAASTNLNNIKQAMAGMPDLSKVDTSSLGQMGALKESTSQLAASTDKASAGLTKTVNGIYAISTTGAPAANKIAVGLSQLNQQTPTLSGAVDQLAAGGKQLVENSSKLTSGANQLASGLKTVNDKTPTLTKGVDKLASGVSTLANGANTLNSKSAELNSGTTKLANGLDTLNGKIPSLTSGVLKLKDGTSQLADGSNELATKLKEGSVKITDLPLSDKTAEMIADPDKTTQTKYSSVPNYGHALAPYFMSVSLFVGALVFNFVYPIRKIADRKGASAKQWFLSKVTIGGLVSTAMALAIGAIMQMIGLEVINQLEFYGILLATAWVNMFLVMFLAMSFDNPGRFVAVLLLVLQLGSAGGVFPMQITSRFYNIVHPYVPMTYSIYGLRQAISTGLGTGVYVESLITLLVLVVVLLVLLRFSMQILFNRGLAGYSQLHNTQKLLDDDYMNTNMKMSKNEKYSLW